MATPQWIAEEIMETVTTAVKRTFELVKGRPFDANESILHIAPTGTEPANVPAKLREAIAALLPGRGKDCSPRLISQADAEQIEDYCRLTGRLGFGNADPGARLKFVQEVRMNLENAIFAVAKYTAIGRLRVHGEVQIDDDYIDVVGIANSSNTTIDTQSSGNASKAGISLSSPSIYGSQVKLTAGGGLKDSREHGTELVRGSSVSEEGRRKARYSKGLLQLLVDLHLDYTVMEILRTHQEKSMDCSVGVFLGEVIFQTLA
jgi:hypothetical protein